MTIPISKWGKDHWSTLAYIEVRCVDGGHKIRKPQMRCNKDRHPQYNHRGEWNTEYGTRLANGNMLLFHDDWDCVDDMVEAGMVVRNGLQVKLTPVGQALAGALRAHKSHGGQWATFNQEEVSDE